MLFCLTILVKLKIFYSFEVNIVNSIPSFQGLTLTLIFLITSLADFLVTLTIIGCLTTYELVSTRMVSRVTLKLLLAFFFATILTLTFKVLVGIERPEVGMLTSTLPNILSFVEEYSYPSGHVTRFTVLMWYFYERWNKKFIPIILLTLVSLTRLALHAHYPTDLVGGILLGLLSYLTIDYFLEKLSFKANF
ncbi:MAG: phosphatase PAP2 family protein [Candidatus Bathyarchaeota archaeon]|nr:phosphatase PAP2 family protein [Candidatus Bathyarchaeota archaeon]